MIHNQLKTLAAKSLEEWQAVERLVLCGDFLARKVTGQLDAVGPAALAEQWGKAVENLKKVRGG